MKPVAIKTVLENNTHDPLFCEAVNKLIDQYGVTFYLGDDGELDQDNYDYDYDSEEVLFTMTQFVAWRNAAGYIRMTEIGAPVGHNDYFSCEA